MTNFIYMTVSASVLITAIIIVRMLFLHKLPKRVFNLLWAVAVLRLMIPFSFSVNMPEYAAVNDSSGAVGEYAITVDRNGSENKVQSGIGYERIIRLIWVCGVVICGSVTAAFHLRYKKRYDTAVLLNDPNINKYIGSAGLKRKITVKISSNIDSPMTAGILEPVIYLPKSIFTMYNKEEINFVLSHELVHIRRFDVIYKFALAAAVSLHWFNGFVWAMYILANRDIELSCDEEVLRQVKCEKSDYAMALIDLEEKRSISLTASCFSSNAVKERIEAIMKSKKISAMGFAASFCLMGCSAAVFAVAEEPVDVSVTVSSYFSSSESTGAENYYEPAADTYLYREAVTSAEDDSVLVGQADSGAVNDGISSENSTAVYQWSIVIPNVSVIKDKVYDDIKTEAVFYGTASADDNMLYVYADDTAVSEDKGAAYEEMLVVEDDKYIFVENAVEENTVAEHTAEEIAVEAAVAADEFSEEAVCMELDELDANILSDYFEYGISFNDREMCYVYNGKNVAGFIDKDYMFLTDGEQAENNGIYIKCIRKNSVISGLKEITLSEFEQIQ